MRRFGTLAVAMAVVVMAAGACYAAVKPTTKASVLPQIWEQAGAPERLKALRVAELDATRLLMERVYGVQLDSDTTIYDLVLNDDTIRAEMAQTIKGVSSAEAPEYLEDGTVQVVRAVKLRQVFDTLSTTIKEKKVLGKTWTEVVVKAGQENQDTVIDVMGNGALPGTAGLKKIQAKRAAEADAYRKLAERLMGVHVTSVTTVKDFILESDMIRARTSQIVKGAKPTRITYDKDGSCEVDIQIKLADVFRVIKYYAKKGKEEIRVDTETATQTFTETGRGAPRPEGQAKDPLSSSSIADKAGAPYAEAEIVIKKLVGQGVVIE